MAPLSVRVNAETISAPNFTTNGSERAMNGTKRAGMGSSHAIFLESCTKFG